jgi:hypothetical protein
MSSLLKRSTNADRRAFLADYRKRREAWVEKVLANPENFQDWHYWCFPVVPKDKLPRVGDIYIWSYRWPDGNVDSIPYLFIRTGGGRKYPWVLMKPLHGSPNEKITLLREFGGDFKKYDPPRLRELFKDHETDRIYEVVGEDSRFDPEAGIRVPVYAIKPLDGGDTIEVNYQDFVTGEFYGRTCNIPT